MSNSINNGGPAFPHEGFKADYEIGKGPVQIPHIFSGMSLRDWFAGQALAGLVPNGALQLAVVEAQTKRPGQEAFLVGQCLARYCYDLADAMLEARNKEVAP